MVLPPWTMPPAMNVLHRRAQDGDQVDPLVLEEIGILGRDEGLDEQFRHAGNRNHDAPLTGEFGDDRAVVAVDPGDDRRPVIGQGVDLGQGAGDEEVGADQKGQPRQKRVRPRPEGRPQPFRKWS